MKVDIWSDVQCPFCYIGKRKFEAALAKFPNGKDIEIEWHSFQLDPDITPQPGKDVYTYLAERKGMTVEQSKQMHKQVVQMAAGEGLEYNFDKAVIANSFDAHRISHLAKKYGKGDAMEEQLFRGYFTEGKDIANRDVLIAMAKNIGIPEQEVVDVLNSNKYAAEVEADIVRASQIGVRGVPFFVLDNKYAVSGAQPSETFLQALTQAWTEYEKANPKLTVVGGDATVCEPGGECK
ncbi:MAG: DsbA family oxidoreductase [Chitinophagales bacterium]|nr:DsbA family oxidoreductase [Chitinophagales bacterium]